MVRVLIQMRLAQLRHSASRSGRWAASFGLAVGLASVLGTLLVGSASYPTTGAATDTVSLVLLLWVSGRVGFTTLAGGDATLRPEIFRLIPVPRRRLARGLLVAGFLDPGLVLLAAAMAALVVLGARLGTVPALVAAVGALALLVLTGVLVTVVGGLVAAPDRRRRGLSTAVLAILISLVAVAGPLLPGLSRSLRDGGARPLSAVVRLLPTGWAGDAVLLAQQGRVTAVVPLAGLVALVVALGAVWPHVLDRRLAGTRTTAAGRVSRRAGRDPVLHGPVGAVLGRELRQWARDPLRSTLLLVAGVVGLGVGLVPFVSAGDRLLMPFAGLLTLVIAGAVAGNLVGADGRALEIVVLTPGAARADGQGRQLAWLLVVGPYVVVSTVVLTAASGQAWAWPWVLSVLPAWLGGAAGLVPLAGASAVQPLDERGGLTPGWPLKTYAVLVLVLLTGAPALAVPVLAVALGRPALGWLGVVVGCVSGPLLAIVLLRAGTRRLCARQLDILATITAAASPR